MRLIGDQIKTAFRGALLVSLTGCTTYIQGPPERVTYYQPPPPQPVPVYVAPPSAPSDVPPPAQVEASVGPGGLAIRVEQDFYEPLSPYGRWQTVGSYGRCWIPGRVDINWRPYCNGRWQRTEAGWYWVSDEPWAWATYHYGRWDFIPQIGWYWVPQTQWAPAWVSWHEGGGYVGWAPLDPTARVSGSSVILNPGAVSPRAFVFVEPRRFLEPVRPTTVVVNNTTIINKTVNITNIRVVNNTVINEGPRTQVIEKASGRKIQPMASRELRRTAEAPVVAHQHTPAPTRDKQVVLPARPGLDGRKTGGQLEAERRAQDAARVAAEQARKAKDLERKVQLEADRRAAESKKLAQQESLRQAKDQEMKAQLESERRTQEAQKLAQDEAHGKVRRPENKPKSGKKPEINKKGEPTENQPPASQ